MSEVPPPLVLVVDDDPDIARFVEVNLRAKGFDVAKAEDGADALAAIDAHAPDVVLTGVMMPRMDGFDLVTRIRRLPEHDRLPVCFLTAKSRVTDKQEGLSRGSDDYLVKPLDPEEMIRHVRSLAEPARPDRPFADPSDVTADEALRYLADRCTAAGYTPPQRVE